MSPGGIFFGIVGVCLLALMTRIARDCSAMADMIHDEWERRRHG